MREIEASRITELVEKLCIEACYVLADDIYKQARNMPETREIALGKRNHRYDSKECRHRQNERVPMCQDTGMTVVFVRMGQECHITGGFIEEAINQGVRQGYANGYLRKSVVKDPIDRVNTTDNTPAIIHYEIVSGDEFHITVAPKGFGSENKSGLKMLTPSAGVKGIKEFVIDTIFHAGGNPCPPIIVASASAERWSGQPSSARKPFSALSAV
nr:fumarate hydratase [Prevotella intermedia]